jgi:hypothetical protein
VPSSSSEPNTPGPGDPITTSGLAPFGLHSLTPQRPVVPRAAESLKVPVPLPPPSVEVGQPEPQTTVRTPPVFAAVSVLSPGHPLLDSCTPLDVCLPALL